MKKFKRFTALFFVVLYLLAATSCQASDKVLQKINNYLTDEYPGKTFEVMSYTQKNETSGRYEVNAVCLDDNIEFEIYIYSTIYASDSYSVLRANEQMEKAIRAELDSFYKNLSGNLKTIQWLDVYEDGAQGYSFRYVDSKKDYTLANLNNTEIYKIEFADGLTISEVGGSIYDFMNDFYSYTPYVVGATTFVYTLNEITYEFTTDAQSIHEMGKTGVVNILLSNTVTSAEKNNKMITSHVEFSYFSESAVPNPNAAVVG